MPLAKGVEVNQLSVGDKFGRWWQTNTGRIPQTHPNVEWISYHIPKTAGSSLRAAFRKAFGTSAVFGVYRHSGAGELSAGQSIWLPSATRIIHGHFRPRRRHTGIFPNARRIVWVRDPLQRSWSLLTRLLHVKENDPAYRILKQRYIDKGVTDKAELFECYLKDNEINRAVFGYQSYFTEILPADFDFIGSVHAVHEDMQRLSNLLNVELDMPSRNTRTGGADIPDSVHKLKPLLKKEYQLVEPYLKQD